MPLIEVIGTYGVKRDSIQLKVQDMLRYDRGEIVEILEDEPSPPEGSGAVHRFKVLVDCETYTPERWKSFMLRTKEVEGR